MPLLPREIPLVPVRVSSVFASRKEEEVDDGDTSILDKERMVGTVERERERDLLDKENDKEREI